ncbi:carboxymethylenebutenolidase homolog isoform X2 [Phoenix dactylifera]|nr:carboxymethylenebutenolidase homolog isoform X2 [Phoenix dactylifera]
MIGQVKLKDDVDDEACELVSGVELSIGEDQDSIHAYLLKAVKNNNGTGVLLLSDVMGFEDPSIRDFAYRVACIGYNVLIPDLFRGNPWNINQPITEFEHWLSRQSPKRVAKDISMSAKWMRDEFMAAGISKKLGIIGFCFGGGHLVETLARDEQAYFGTGVCFYGTNMNPSVGSSIKVPVLFICGDNDLLCPISIQQEMEKNTGGSKLKIYSGREHGFAHRPKSDEEDQDAEDAFAIMRNWLHDDLLVRKDHA